MSEYNLTLEPTPNPNALKFILDRKVKEKGNSTYKTPTECADNHLAYELFSVRGVDEIHFFDQTITITKFSYIDWDDIEQGVAGVLDEHLAQHNPDYHDPDPEEERRASLPQELREIEEILDRTIRPGLQADGGDVQCVNFEDNVLLVRYQGACGTCPSSTTGTLEAIKSILRNEYSSDLDVYIAPDL